jgi:hypothetical protein
MTRSGKDKKGLESFGIIAAAALVMEVRQQQNQGMPATPAGPDSDESDDATGGVAL